MLNKKQKLVSKQTPNFSFVLLRQVVFYSTSIISIPFSLSNVKTVVSKCDINKNDDDHEEHNKYKISISETFKLLKKQSYSKTYLMLRSIVFTKMLQSKCSEIMFELQYMTTKMQS